MKTNELPGVEPYLLIGTPAYNGQLHVDYLHAILGFQRAKVKFDVLTIANESLITRARNSLLATFWENEKYTHLLFLDADVFLDYKGLVDMLKHDKDVIGAPVFLKGKNQNGEQTINTDAKPSELPVLQSVNRVGTAVFMLNKKAANSLVEYAIKEQRVYQTHKMLEYANAAKTHYDIFRVGIFNGEYLSEDFWVCQELRKLGFEVFVDTSVYTRHNGMLAFD